MGLFPPSPRKTEEGAKFSKFFISGVGGAGPKLAVISSFSSPLPLRSRKVQFTI